MKLSKVVFAGFLLISVSLFLEARYSYEHIWNAIFDNTKNTIRIFPYVGSIFDVTGSSVNITGTVPISVCSTLTVADERYENKLSTHTAGKVNASGNIPNTGFKVTNYSFYSVGADSEITGIGGTIHCLNGVPANTPSTLEIGFSTPTFVVSLGSGATLYYEIWGTE